MLFDSTKESFSETLNQSHVYNSMRTSFVALTKPPTGLWSKAESNEAAFATLQSPVRSGT